MPYTNAAPSNLAWTPKHQPPGPEQVEPIVFLIDGSGLGFCLLILFFIATLAMILREGQG
jgi:hypothetical protein